MHLPTTGHRIWTPVHRHTLGKDRWLPGLCVGSMTPCGWGGWSFRAPGARHRVVRGQVTPHGHLILPLHWILEARHLSIPGPTASLGSPNKTQVPKAPGMLSLPCQVPRFPSSCPCHWLLLPLTWPTGCRQPRGRGPDLTPVLHTHGHAIEWELPVDFKLIRDRQSPARVQQDIVELEEQGQVRLRCMGSV